MSEQLLFRCEDILTAELCYRARCERRVSQVKGCPQSSVEGVPSFHLGQTTGTWPWQGCHAWGKTHPWARPHVFSERVRLPTILLPRQAEHGVTPCCLLNTLLEATASPCNLSDCCPPSGFPSHHELLRTSTATQEASFPGEDPPAQLLDLTVNSVNSLPTSIPLLARRAAQHSRSCIVTHIATLSPPPKVAACK